MTELQLKTVLSHLLVEANHQPMTYRTICQILAGKGYPALLIILSLPFCTPITIPGLSTSFGLVIAFIGLRLAFGYHVWWPDWLMDKTMSYSTLEKVVQKTITFINWIQKILYPRLEFLAINPILNRIHGLLIFFLALVLALPLPLPFSNMLPALPILLISLGLLEDDGVFVLLGYLFAFICFSIFGVGFWKGAQLLHLVA